MNGLLTLDFSRRYEELHPLVAILRDLILAVTQVTTLLTQRVLCQLSS